MSLPTLAVDFDNCIHGYQSGWKGVTNIPDPPVPGAIRWLVRAIKFWRVHIYSTRSASAVGRDAMKLYVYLNACGELDKAEAEKLVETLEFPEHKPPALLTIDDRAVTFNGDWEMLDPEKLRGFVPWPRLEARDREPCPHCGRSGWRQPWFSADEESR